MTIRGSVVLAGSLALPLSIAAIAAMATPPTSTLRTTVHFDPGSTGAKAALAWLSERRAEDPAHARELALDPIAAGDVDIEIVTAAVGHAPSDDLAQGETTLPSAGTPGQTVAIGGCVAHSARTAATYAWHCDAAAKCHWELEHLEVEKSAQVACSTR